MPHVLRLDLVGGRHAGLTRGQNAGGDAFDDVSDVTSWQHAVADRVHRRRNSATRVMPEDDDEWDVQHGYTELDRAKHTWVNDMACGADYEEVTKTAVEDDLGRYPRVRTAEEDSERRLAPSQAVPARCVLVGVPVLAGDEPIIATGQLGPGCSRSPRTRGRSGADLAHSPGRFSMLIASGLAVSA